MRRRWNAWVAMLDTRERGSTLAAFRMAIAAVVLYSLVSIRATDLLDVLWTTDAGYRPLQGFHWLLDLLGGPTVEVVHGLWATAFAGACLLLLGVGGRWAALLALQAYLPLVSINGQTTAGFDMMMTNALWLLFLSRCTATLSVDCRRRTGRWRSDDLVPAWPRYLVLLQLIIIYTSTGLMKLGAPWTPVGGFSALYWVYQDPTWVRAEVFGQWAAVVYPLTQLATFTTWVWELTAPVMLLIYYRRYSRGPGRFDLRKPWIAIGVGVHLGILVTLNVGAFSLVSMAYYLCFMTPVGETRAAQAARWPGAEMLSPITTGPTGT